MQDPCVPHRVPHPPKKLQMALMLLSKATCAALLAHDARLVPRETLEIESLDLEDRSRRAAATMFGVTEEFQARQRLRLVGALGGWTMTSWAAPRIAARVGLVVVVRADEPTATAASQRLLDVGIYADRNGRVEFTRCMVVSLNIRRNSGGASRLVSSKSSPSRFGVGSSCSTAKAWSLLQRVSHSSHFQNSHADASNQETVQFRKKVFGGLSFHKKAKTRESHIHQGMIRRKVSVSINSWLRHVQGV